MSLAGAQCTCDEKSKSIAHRLGAPCPVHGTSGKALAEHVEALEKAVVKLQERVAHAELARDNAIAQRDAVQERAKAKAQSAGQRISALVALAREHAGFDERRLAEILGADESVERTDAERLAFIQTHAGWMKRYNEGAGKEGVISLAQYVGMYRRDIDATIDIVQRKARGRV